MKGKRPLTNSERQAIYRASLALKNGNRLSVTIDRPASASLEVIQKWLKSQNKPDTKKAAIEAALVLVADNIRLGKI